MSGNDMATMLSQLPVLTILLAVVIALLFLYAARQPLHLAIKSIGTSIYQGLRLASRAVMQAEMRLRERNRSIILSEGRESRERLLEHEFQRIHTIVRKDMSGYPALHRVLSEQLTKIEEDYEKSTDVPPSPPQWLEAIDAVAKIPAAKDNSAVAEILLDIHATLDRIHKESMKAYRKSCRDRHSLLRKMRPYWRKLSYTLTGVERKVNDLDARIPTIDKQMQQYEDIVAKKDRAEKALATSYVTQFFVSGIVLLIAVMGGFINFQLIALPMSEMVGGNSYLGPLKTADVAALVIILVEIAMGIFLMESLRITHMFSAIQAMDDHMRRRMVVVTLLILFALASVESALAYMRDILAADRAALTQSLAGVAVAEPGYRWIASVGQMVMGFILPFALTCAAIPLESFVHASRAVIGSLLASGLRLTAFGLRFAGQLARQASLILVQLYDAVIFIPLWLENRVKGGHKTSRSAAAASAATPQSGHGRSEPEPQRHDSGTDTSFSADSVPDNPFSDAVTFDEPASSPQSAYPTITEDLPAPDRSEPAPDRPSAGRDLPVNLPPTPPLFQ